MRRKSVFGLAYYVWNPSSWREEGKYVQLIIKPYNYNCIVFEDLTLIMLNSSLDENRMLRQHLNFLIPSPTLKYI